MKLNLLWRRSFLYHPINEYRQNREVIKWLKEGRPSPTPHLIKQLTIKEYAKAFNLSILVETGTYMGDMVYAMKDNFRKIMSIELSPELMEAAKKRFANFEHIEILNGDSGQIIPKILSSVSEPVLFWLDAHYSGGFTAKDKVETPIIKELQYIFELPCNHVILIDDARCFTGENDYPTLEEVRDFVLQKRPKFQVDIESDIIRIFPKA
jgi:hypothetical protein